MRQNTAACETKLGTFRHPFAADQERVDHAREPESMIVRRVRRDVGVDSGTCRFRLRIADLAKVGVRLS